VAELPIKIFSIVGMSSLQVESVKKVKELSQSDTLLLTQIHSLQLKNITLELRLIRMEQHLNQLIKHTNFPVSNLTWGPQPL